MNDAELVIWRLQKNRPAQIYRSKVMVKQSVAFGICQRPFMWFRDATNVETEGIVRKLNSMHDPKVSPYSFVVGIRKPIVHFLG